MRDLETIETALTAAETGHLVFGTVHTNSAADSIDRVVDVFPAQRQQQGDGALSGWDWSRRAERYVSSLMTPEARRFCRQRSIRMLPAAPVV